MTHINYARLFLIVLCLTALGDKPLTAQIATHRLGVLVGLQIAGQNTAASFVQRYALTNAANVSQYTTNALPFSSIPVGQCKAYAVNYDGTQTAPTLTVGTAIGAIGGTYVNASAALPVDVLNCNNTTGNISATITGQNTGAAFTQKYVLADSSGRILQIPLDKPLY